MNAQTALLLLLSACAVDGELADPLVAAPETWSYALQTVDPVWVVDLVDDPSAYFPIDGDCPMVERQGDTESWVGGCVQSDGAQVDGVLERHLADDTSWVAADAFSVSRDGELILSLDGAVEMLADAELLLVEAAMTACADGLSSCGDGPVAFDLDWTLLIGAGWPDAYDATVSGFIAAPGRNIAAIQGAWTLDRSLCASEPTEGSFGLRQGDRHTLVLDGASTCDSCAAWQVQGVVVPAYCGLSL